MNNCNDFEAKRLSHFVSSICIIHSHSSLPLIWKFLPQSAAQQMKLIEYITMHIALNIATRRHLYFWVDLYWCSFWNPSTLKTHQLREPPPQPYEHESPKIQFQMSDIFSPRSLHHSCVVTVHWRPCQSLSSAIITATSLSTSSLGAWIVCHDLCARNAAFTFLSRTECCLIPSLRQKIEIFNLKTI